MSDSEKLKSQKELTQSIVYKWTYIRPCIFLLWIYKGLSWIYKKILHCSRHWSLFKLLRNLECLTILVAVIFYFWGCEDRQKTKHYQAWQVISAAQGKTGDLGRKIALQDLNSDGISLAGVDISHATIKNLNLENADLSEAILSKAVLIDANLSEANLFFADLNDTDLHNVNLSDVNLVLADLSEAYLTFADLQNTNLGFADLSDADLRYVDFSGAILTEIRNWEQIVQINNANLHDVKNPPKGFIKWALEHGAVSMEDDEEWKKLRRKKLQEERERRKEKRQK